MTQTRLTGSVQAGARSLIRRIQWRVGVLLLLSGCVLFGQQVSAGMMVRLDTTNISGTSAVLAFDLIDGDGLSNNGVSITSFVTDGTLGSGAATGGVSGLLPGSVLMSDSDFFNEYLQPIVLGNSVSFSITFTNNRGVAGVPDAFSFFILDSAAAIPLVSSELPGSALLMGDFLGDPGQVVVVAAQSTSPTVSIDVTSPATVPEPAAWHLLLGAAFGLTGWRSARLWWTRLTNARCGRRAIPNLH